MSNKINPNDPAMKFKSTMCIFNDHAWLNDTWLSPYTGYVVELRKYSNGQKSIVVDGCEHFGQEGKRYAPNEWVFKIEQILTPINELNKEV